MKKSSIAVMFVFLLISLLLCSCGGSSGSMDKSDAIADYEVGETGSLNGAITSDNVQLESGTSIESTKEVAANRKIIETVSLNVETKEFDQLTEKILKEVSSIGGYVENSSISGRGYYDSYSSNRYAEYKVRIPADKSEEFTEFISANSIVTSRNIETDDITLTYVDMESRVSALQTEKKTLEKILESAETVSEVIEIQKRISEIIYQMESYQSQLRIYDNLIDYTTVHIYVQEVERATITKEQSMWEEITTKFKNNFEDVVENLRDCIIWFVSSLPYLVVYAVIITAAALVVRILRTRNRARRTEKVPRKKWRERYKKEKEPSDHQ